jgi:meso-butanediol dehydrogenase/(S,S)-butanediol dehydrogenase/diacetyl reductase
VNDSGRVALVTGGGTGIGAAIARRFGAAGTAVAVVGRRPEPLTAIVAEIEAAGGRALAIPADLAELAVPADIVARTTAAFGRLDVVVNNAAVIKNLPLDEMPVATFDEHLAVNIRAPFLLLQAALPWLKASPAAAVVNISSSSGSLSIPGQATYGLTKAALEYMTRSYAAELAPFGIRVNCIAPGPIDTPIHLTWAKDMATAYVALRAASPLGLIGDPDDIARWVEHLADPRERFVTGAVFAIDAGQTLNGWASAIASAAGPAGG